VNEVRFMYRIFKPYLRLKCFVEKNILIIESCRENIFEIYFKYSFKILINYGSVVVKIFSADFISVKSIL
jgi:hypothetical protein